MLTDPDYEANKVRASALPMFGDGPIPVERDRSVDEDDSGFLDVLLLLLRSWPYIRPQLLGRWYQPGKGYEDRVADNVAGGGYSFAYAPVLVFAIAVAGPLLGYVPASLEWPWYLLYGPVFVMVACISVMAFSNTVQVTATVGLLLGGIAANIVASYVLDGWADGVYAGLVTLGCLMG